METGRQVVRHCCLYKSKLGDTRLSMTTSNKDLHRFKEHFPQESELTLQVLKGHLLVEEIIRETLEASLPNADALKGESGTTLNCHQAICILEATLPPKGGLPWIWTACKMLNRIRNDLAHRLEQTNLQTKVDNLVQYCTKSDPSLMAEATAAGMPAGEQKEFTLVVLALCAAISALRDSLLKRSRHLGIYQ